MSLFSLTKTAQAAPGINAELPFYGTLKDASGNELTGTYDMVFRLYDAATAGTLLDTSTHTAANGNAVAVDDGEFFVLLGSGTGNELDGVDFNDDSIFVGLTVGSDSEMSPRTQLGAAAYAFNADTVDGLEASAFLQNNATATLATTTIDHLIVNAGLFLASSSPASTTNTIYNLGGTLYFNGSTVGGGSSLFTDVGSDTYLTSLTDNLLVGTSSQPDNARLTVVGGGFEDILNVYTSSGVQMFSIGSRDIAIEALDDFNGGDIDLSGGSGANGGDVTIAGGYGTFPGSGGNLTLSAGIGSTPGDVVINAGDSNGTDLGGEVTISAGSGGASGGDISVTAGDGGSGNIGADGGSIVFTAGTAGISVLPVPPFTSPANGGAIVFNSGGAGNNGGIQGYIALNASASTTNDYVGVGTSSPRTKLDVFGDFQVGTTTIPNFFVASSSRFVGLGTTTATAASMAIQTSGTNDILNLFETGGEEVFTILESGNVGIGTTSPSNALELGNGNFVVRQADMTVVGSTTAAVLEQARKVVVVGQYAYVAAEAGDGLVVVDISQPTNPQVVGSATSTNLNEAHGLAISGTYAYVTAAAANRLVVVDISNPANPVELTAVAGSAMTGPREVVVRGSYAYVVSEGGAGSLTVFDISDPTNPTETGLLSGRGPVTELAFRGNYAFLKESGTPVVSSIQVIDVTDPTDPVLVSTYTGANLDVPRGIDIEGRYLYVVTESGSSLAVIDISDPTNLSLVGTTTNANLDRAFALDVAGDYAYVGAINSNVVTAFDVSDPTNPREVGTVSGIAGPIHMHVVGGYAYVAGLFDDTLSVVDISGIRAPGGNFGSLAANELNLDQDLLVGASALVQGSLNVGADSFVQGGFSVLGTSSSTLQNGAGAIFRADRSGVAVGTTTGRAQLTVQTSSTTDILNLFETGGEEVFTVLENGNVGIGTTTPSYLLDVDGDSRVTGDLLISSSAGISSFFSQGGGHLALQAGGSNSILRLLNSGGTEKILFNHQFSDFYNELFYIQSLFGGYVAVGTTTSSARFSVQAQGTTDILNLFETGGTEVFTVLESGNVGIGETSPDALLHVVAAAAVSPNYGSDADFIIEDGSGIPELLLVNTGAGSGEASISFANASGGDDGRINFNQSGEIFTFLTTPISGDDSGTLIERMRISGNGVSIGTSSSNIALSIQATTTNDILNLFEADGEEVFTVLESGNVGIGTTTPTANLHASGTIRFENLGSAGANLVTDLGGNVTVSSDERLKDINSTFDTGLDAILAIEPIQYNWAEGTGYDTINEYTGFSAQNVQLVLPEAVSEDRQGFLTLADRPILAAVINAIQEMWETVTGNQERISELEARLEILEAELEIETDVTEGEPELSTPVEESPTETEEEAEDVNESGNEDNSESADDQTNEEDENTPDTASSTEESIDESEDTATTTVEIINEEESESITVPETEAEEEVVAEEAEESQDSASEPELEEPMPSTISESSDEEAELGEPASEPTV